MALAISLFVVFLLNLLLTRLWISLQERQKRGQPIRDYGPELHTHKKGIPTAGGVPFLLVALVGWGAWTSASNQWDADALFVAGATLGFALIGMLDDALKVFQQHARGLPVRYKLLFQMILSALLGWWTWGQLPSLQVPFWDSAIALSPALATIFLALVFISTVNAFNETDGLDGLLGGVTLIALGAYGVILWLQNESALLSMVFIAIAALLGFLWWNVHPARVIMG
ncbi:MAG: phospho-N-acetylmuramoyl-pentapeptide-transferase, partial [Candidatus Bipolaricaulota bacterium]|nr:phospho-N-acetylmuramoyl-pentapeptide-transferase [Candidatus Bipolaricaulota bacterium]